MADNVDDMLMDIDSLEGDARDGDADVSMTDPDSDAMEPFTYKNHTLDCYPYTFSPLLLFSTDGYFDRGYSNYNAVASFFDPILRDVLGDDWEDDADDDGVTERSSPRKDSRSPGMSPQKDQEKGAAADSRGGINMLEGVVYERKNMT